MKNSLIRVLISLFLCCCLVLNVAAIPVRATSFLDWLIHQIGTDIGVSAILEGLGLFRDASSDYFDELITEIEDDLATAGYVTNGMMTAYYQVDPLGVANPLFAIPASILNFIRNWVFDNGIVVSNASIRTFLPEGSLYKSYTMGSDAVILRWCSYSNYSSTRLKYEVHEIVVSLVPDFKYVTGSMADSIVTSGGNTYWYKSIVNQSGYIDNSTDSINDWLSGAASGYPYIAGNPSVESVFNNHGQSDFVTDKEITLGQLAPPGTMFTSAYPLWLEHERQLEDGTTETLVQIGLGNTLAETEELTQEQIWTGQGTLQVPEQGQTAVNLQDILQGIIQLPVQMVTSIQTALQTFFVPSGNIQAYSLDLKALFPFCIPFDIYDFLAALSADPVPPVFEFDLNLGVATEPMKIDLSNWSDLAAIIRTLELGLFCVGLALKTRELIGG